MNASGIYDVAALALECICDQMDSIALASSLAYPGCPCVKFVSAGEPALDCCLQDECESGGQLTVHVEELYPSDTFPQPSGSFEPCKAATWVASIVVTIARCAPVMDEQGNPAPMDEQNANAELLAIDTYAIMTALSCCLVNEPVGGKRKRRVQIAGSRPVTTSGGCAAVEVRAFVDAGQVCACAAETS